MTAELIFSANKTCLITTNLCLNFIYRFSPKEWKDPDPSARTCIGQTKPVEGPKYPGPSHPGEAVVRSVISKMARPAYLLDITLLTQLRKDGHPGRYATKSLKLNDCSHWCLAGVPDTWNQLLYAALLQN